MPASSREKPIVICVRSLVPNEKNCACAPMLSAISAARGGYVLAEASSGTPQEDATSTRASICAPSLVGFLAIEISALAEVAPAGTDICTGRAKTRESEPGGDRSGRAVLVDLDGAGVEQVAARARPGQEAHLTVTWTLGSATPWAPRGQLVA